MVDSTQRGAEGADRAVNERKLYLLRQRQAGRQDASPLLDGVVERAFTDRGAAEAFRVERERAARLACRAAGLLDDPEQVWMLFFPDSDSWSGRGVSCLF